jgi:hypothetical protein
VKEELGYDMRMTSKDNRLLRTDVDNMRIWVAWSYKIESGVGT